MKVEIDVSKVGMVSCVGILCEKYPLGYGNYFSCDGHYMMNMWYENLEYLLEQNIIKPGTKLKGRAFGKGVVITDDRLPEGYLNEKLCITGSMGMVQNYDEAVKFWKEEYQNRLRNKKLNRIV